MPPVALLAIAFALGIAARETFHLPRFACSAALVLTSLLLVVAWRRRRLFGMASLIHALALGALAALAAWPHPRAGLLDGRPWQVTARVVTGPERAFERTHLVVELEQVSRRGRARTAAGRVRLALEQDPLEPLAPGDHVRFLAKLQPARGFAEPGAPDPARRHAERGVIAVAGLFDAAALARLIPPAALAPSGASSETQDTYKALQDTYEEIQSASLSPRDAIARRVLSLRARLLGTIAARLDGERRALVEALVLGERARVPQALEDAFRGAGVNHVLSVSGLHLAAAAFLLLVGLRKLLACVTPLARRVAVHRVAAACALPAAVLYALVTGAATATVRALAVAAVFLVGLALGRGALTAAAFGAAAFALLGASPLAVYDPSLQLSFAAALGAAFVAPPALRLVTHGPLDGKRLPARLGRFTAGLLFTSAATLLVTAPITAHHFTQIAPAGLIANLVVVPLAELFVLPVGLIGCLLSAAAPSAGGLLLDAAGAGASAMAAIARWFAAALPPGVVRGPALVEALLTFAMVVALALALGGNGRRAWRAVALCAIGLIVAIGAHAIAPRLRPALTVTFLDVGQGDAAFVELPDGRNMLVDGSGAPMGDGKSGFDPGRQLIVPWLLRRGVDHLDFVVLTHPHPDHAGGLAAVVERFPTSEIWTNGAPSELPALLRLVEAARARGVPIVRPRALDGPAQVELLHPVYEGAVRVPGFLSENDGSIVLRIRYRGRAVLLTGDIEKQAESRLVGQMEHPGPIAALAADVVKAPHHGSDTSSNVGFVEAVQAKVVVFSCGLQNRWGFPKTEVVERWRAAGATTFRTDEDGAVTVRVDPEGDLSVETARHPR